VTEAELTTVLSLLERSHGLDPSSPQFLALERAVAHLAKSAKKKRRLQRSQKSRAEDRALADATGLSRKRLGTAPAETRTLNRARHCYVCKRPYRELDTWYHLLCPDCGARSEAMRGQPLELKGRRALVTGGRVKIGYATALRMLRAGAEVHVTTRFPRDAEQRFAQESDAASWRERLHVHGLDFRDLNALVEALERWRAGPSFDIVINNAAQSVWHPPEYFEKLRAGEEHALVPLDFVTMDVRREDSWVQRLGKIAPIDMVEVQVVNSIAPFLVCDRLRPNLARSPFQTRFIVNVTAVEGQFGRAEKSTRHPHTNMAKAGLNMLTRTSAADLAGDGIFMVSVDPGWMSREGKEVDPTLKPPLEAEDCAARVLHPIAHGLAGEPLYGVLLKDFTEVPW
jgi:NAD(P)-dependent dehydrogenase (short-subunit alcohol dehydrogenase family)